MTCYPVVISQEYMDKLKAQIEADQRMRLAGWQTFDDEWRSPSGHKISQWADPIELHAAIDCELDEFHSRIAARWEAP